MITTLAISGYITFEVLEHTLLPYVGYKVYQHRKNTAFTRSVKRALSYEESMGTIFPAPTVIHTDGPPPQLPVGEECITGYCMSPIHESEVRR